MAGKSAVFIKWLSLLFSRVRKRNSQGQALQQGSAKVAAAETERVFIQIGLEIFLGQAMIGAQNKRLGVADHDVQPMEEAGIRGVGVIFMGVVLQRRDVTAIAIAEDHAAIGEGSVGKFPHRHLLNIGRYPHFQKTGIALLIQGQRYENLRFFCALPPLFSCCWATKVRIIKVDDSAQLMSFISLDNGNVHWSVKSGQWTGGVRSSKIREEKEAGEYVETTRQPQHTTGGSGGNPTAAY